MSTIFRLLNDFEPDDILLTESGIPITTEDGEPISIGNINVPVAYGYFDKDQVPPYLCFLGSGQDKFEADNTFYTKRNRYQIEYYFRKKDTAFEDELEAFLLANGFKYEKSEDIYLDDQDLFMIYYDI